MAVTRLRWQSVAIGGNQWGKELVELRTRVGRDEIEMAISGSRWQLPAHACWS